MPDGFPHLFGEEHADPDFVFVQPWRPTCWNDDCDEPSSWIFQVWFPTTVFVQGICPRHLERLRERLGDAGFEMSEHGARNNAELDAVRLAALGKGGVTQVPESWDRNFPADWHRSALRVIFTRVARPCWYRAPELESACPKPTFVSMLVWRLPPGMARRGRILAVPGGTATFARTICKGHLGGLQIELKDAGFSFYFKRTGGTGYKNPRCMLPNFGDVDWIPGDEPDELHPEQPALEDVG